jgi:hypothetical protein
VVDPGGRRIFVGLNGGPDLEDSAFGHVVLAVVELDGEPAGTASATSAAVDAIACRSVRPAELESSGRDGIAFVDATVDRGLLDPLTGMYGHAVAAGDVDSDGWLDLFVGGFADRPSGDYAVRGADGPSPDQLLLGGPDGFRPDPTFPGERARTSGATLADLDGDGDLDLVAVRNPRSGGPVTAAPTTIFENTAEGWERSTELASDVSARAAAALDVDGDGRLDLLVAGDRFGTSGTRAYRNEGGLSFVDASAAWGVPEDLTGLAMATVDLDGDGWRDVVVNGDERVLRGGPDGFTVEREADLTWELLGDEDDPAGVAVGDLDGDGRPDLVLGQHFNSTIDDGARVPVRILLNRSVARGGLELVDVTATAGSPGLWTKSPHVAVADIDADGRPDIVTSAVTASGAPLVLRNLGRRDGVPRFQPVGEPGSGAYYVTGVTADLDLDGRVDLFQVAWEPDRASTLFRNVSDVGSSIRVDLAALADPAGSVVRVTTGDGTVRTAWAASTTGYAAGAPAVVEIGVGPAGSDDAADHLRAEISPPGRPPLVLDPCT